MISNTELYNMARSALKNAYAPYSSYRVGAALMTKSGRVYTGVNVENAAYGETICAERVAVSKAISEGDREIKKIAIAIENGKASPCGSCRQFIFEFGDNIEIITGEDTSKLDVCKICDLLPGGFRL